MAPIPHGICFGNGWEDLFSLLLRNSRYLEVATATKCEKNILESGNAALEIILVEPLHL